MLVVDTFVFVNLARVALPPCVIPLRVRMPRAVKVQVLVPSSPHEIRLRGASACLDLSFRNIEQTVEIILGNWG
jgi:hypothetical protein